eukprot:TRINITY_DN6391_c0_g2_i1.p1 TRINITY_DN6391_c0_g2~~TRINITY_DN6391_c0_g2_i1.p1  ORF type:complete len:105 (-),score=1.90 TRINITY_DN6391_c0_g2_i1:620-934(-)
MHESGARCLSQRRGGNTERLLDPFSACGAKCNFTMPAELQKRQSTQADNGKGRKECAALSVLKKEGRGLWRRVGDTQTLDRGWDDFCVARRQYQSCGEEVLEIR